MPIVADGAVRVGADLDPFNKELKSGLGKAETQAQSFGQKMNAALSPKNLAAGLGIGFGVAQLTSFFGDAINAAAQFEDSVSAVGVIFGEEMIPQMEEWGESAAQNFGASKQEALAAANQIAGMGKMAGLAGDQLVGFSKELVELGGDLASMYGGTTQDAITAVGAALRGEMEPIRRYNVLLDDATLRQKAFEMGLISTTTNALTPQQKVLAAHAAIMDQTTDAQGDYARTSEGMANSQRTLTKELENVSIEVGQKLLPVMVKLVNFLSDTGIPVMREFLRLLSSESPDSAQGIPVLGEIEDTLNAISDASLVSNDMLWGREQQIRDAAEAIGVDYMTMRSRIRQVLDDVGGDHDAAIDRIVNGLKPLPDQMAQAMHDTSARLREGGVEIDAAAADMADGVPGAMEGALAAGAEVARKTPGALADELRAGIDDYDAALAELTEVAVNSVSDLAERQKIEGILASTELTDALNSDSTRTRLLAADLVTDLVSDYELLAPGALAAGELVNPELAAGMNSNLGLTEDAAEAIVDAAGNPLVEISEKGFEWGSSLSANFIAGMESQIVAMRNTSIRLGDAAAHGIRFRSPAKGGPLSDRGVMGGWGEMLGLKFASGMLATVPKIQGASLAMAGAAVLSPTASAFGSVGVGAVSGGVGGNSYNVQLVDRLDVRTVEDIGYGLKRLEDLGKLPGSRR